MTRFNLVDASALALPGNCTICGSVAPDRKYIDFGLNIEFVGSVYFCTLCMAEAVRLMGFIDPEVHVKLVHELAESKQAIEGLERDCTDLHALVDSLNLFGALPNQATTVGITSETSDPPTERFESATPEPASSGGRKDIPDLGIPKASAKSGSSADSG